ncbi:MAG: PucR family transcriptional regulator ligand-binding domain-containing protein, partial [Oscillospiraceae bacterium]
MKVRDLFSLNSEFTNLKLLAGKDGLDREITKVEIMEVPDGVFWAKENSMIVTMGYSLKKNDITTDSLVQMLIEKKVSALGIKMGRYIEEIPQRVLDYADDNAFPIINIPLSLSYDQIITPINNRLLDSASYESYIVRDLRKKLRNLVRHDYSPESVLGLMAGYINKKVTIMWAGNFNYVSGYPFQNAEILTDIVKNNIKAIYECDGEITLSSSGRSFTIFKLENAHSLSALLCVEITPDNPITNTDYEIIEELIPTLTLYLLSNSNLEFSKNKSNENLFFDLIQCKYKSNDLKLVEDASFL